jgi:hypothetical protein
VLPTKPRTSVITNPLVPDTEAMADSMSDRLIVHARGSPFWNKTSEIEADIAAHVAVVALRRPDIMNVSAFAIGEHEYTNAVTGC